MGFMIPVAECLRMWHVDTNFGTEYVPEDVCGNVENTEELLQYCEGSKVFGSEMKEGWYGRLSAPGYLDCTEWMGPYDSADEAIDAVCEQYDVDDDGNPRCDDEDE